VGAAEQGIAEVDFVQLNNQLKTIASMLEDIARAMKTHIVVLDQIHSLATSQFSEF